MKKLCVDGILLFHAHHVKQYFRTSQAVRKQGVAWPCPKAAWRLMFRGQRLHMRKKVCSATDETQGICYLNSHRSPTSRKRRRSLALLHHTISEWTSKRNMSLTLLKRGHDSLKGQFGLFAVGKKIAEAACLHRPLSTNGYDSECTM